MENNEQTDFDKFFDDDGDGVTDGQLVRVNGSHVGKITLIGDGDFVVEGWPVDDIVDTLEVVPEPMDTANIHPTIKE